MRLRFLAFLLPALVLLSLGTIAQAPSRPAGNPPAAHDYAKEAFVFESIHNTIRFDKDGTGERQNDVRVRVQSEAGVQQLGLLVVGYNAAFDKLDVRYARVVKPDGTIVDASGESIQDLPAEVQRVAPQYTDLTRPRRFASSSK